MNSIRKKSLINHSLLSQHGFQLLNNDTYGMNLADQSINVLKNEFNHLVLDKSPGSRYRAYLKLLWNRKTNNVEIAKDQRYYQSYQANNADRGIVREFKQVNKDIFANAAFQQLLEKNKEYISHSKDISRTNDLILGIHFIRYHVEEGKAAYSSPIWLHVDDEPLVFVHLINLSENAIGGDNLIAAHKGEIQGVIRLKNFMDTLVLNRKVRHAVTPLGSVNGIATRDVILFTVEPIETNQLGNL